MPSVLITGATDGLGRQVALDLAAAGWTVLLHGRSRERGKTLLRELRAAGAAEARLYIADLASLDAVRRLADELLAGEDRIDVLCNNAGVGSGPRGAVREESADGLELRFAVNYLSHFLLTQRLLERVGSRIVNVASAGQQAIDFDDVQLERGWTGTRAYCQSKLAQIMFTFSLAERIGGDVTVNALHPATYMHTKMVLESRGASLNTVADGAGATERLIADPALVGVTGRYFNVRSEATADPQAYDAGAREALWELSEQLTS
jgi:NAD(P)-dependent dehydrogenase (short-subunit alcohol dehydrogenase family)